jgi:FixJ family two-component response regulator
LSSMAEQAQVFVVDDDASLRESMSSLFRSVGLRVKAYPSASDFMHDQKPDSASCLVLDVRLPGVSGLDFQAELTRANVRIPIVFITGHGDIPMSVRAMKAGAVEFLTKPFRDQDMLDAVQAAIETDRQRRVTDAASSTLKSRFETLTPREREIMALVGAGRLNKQIAGAISISEVTVKMHRGSMMRKMGAKSVADLVRMSEILGVSRT